MSTDRELVEQAVKAMGLTVKCWRETSLSVCAVLADAQGAVLEMLHNPADDDGIGARMEAALSINVKWLPACVSVSCTEWASWIVTETFDAHGGDKQAARRRASLRLAAMMGRAKQ